MTQTISGDNQEREGNRNRCKSLSIGIFENTPHFLAFLCTLLTTAGHRVVSCSTASQPLDAFLESLIEHLKQMHSSPYDVVILVASSQELGSHTHLLLEQLVSFELLPLVFFTNAPCSDRKPFFFSVQVTPFLSRSVFSPDAFAEAMEAATGVAFPLAGAVAKILSQWHREQIQEAIQAHQAWIDQRQQWLRQRLEWISQRQVWLVEQRLWINQQRKQSEAQDAWLDEQQAWIKARQDETNQQEHRLQYQRHWLIQQQQKLDLFKITTYQRTPPDDIST